MKHFAILISAILFFSACSGRISLVKRQYSRGYYVSIVKKQTTKPTTLSKSTPGYLKSAPDPQPNRHEFTEVARKAEEAPRQLSIPIYQSRESKSKVITACAMKGAIIKAANKKELRLKTHIDAPRKGSSDLPFIVMVILCFIPFINLIPVYIHDNRSITINFWLTLILDCLAFVPGIVYALLVVLDLVDMR